jgi:arylsulfatase A-like enzyme
MIRNVPAYCKRAALHLLIVLCMYEITRVIFYFYNYHYFSEVHFSSLLYYMLVGLRFDIPAIILTNTPFIILSIVPYGREESIYRRYVVLLSFMIVNSITLLMQLADTVLFSYVYKRSTADVFKFLSLGDDTTNLLPNVIKGYWYILLIVALLIALMGYLYKQVNKKPIHSMPADHHYIAASISYYIIGIGLLVLGFRGGWQLKPLSIIDAAEDSPIHDIALVTNTPFSIIKTFGAPPIAEYHFFAPELLSKMYSTSHPASDKPLRRLNVVTIILESFSKEYVGALNNLHRTSTPFIDSLIGQSLTFDDAFSDGKKSIEGIPAVVSGLPTWMDEPYITSSYNSDNPISLAALLSKIGYRTAFFHGGNNGTMGFTSFCKEVGYDYYYGRTQYNNDSDYDGLWGIWDEPFFQYFAKSLDTLRKPFFATIFSISSHHPFSIPNKYKSRFKQEGDELPILKCVRYSDMALREFFKTASAMPWFDSTLFIITADHTGPSAEAYYSNRVGMYEIPIIYYMHNSELKGKSYLVTQHIDILPSILDYLHYPYPYFAFGKSVFDTTGNQHCAVSYINGCYQLVKGPYCVQIENKKVTALYNFEKDSMLTHNLIDEKPMVKDSMTMALEAIMQTYSSDIIHNKLQ